MYVCVCEKSISFTDHVVFGCCLRNRWQKCCILYHTFRSWNYLYMMRKEDDDWKITTRSGRWCMYTHVFGLRLSPSMCSSFSLCLSSSFLKTACAQAHHMCYRRTHPFFFSLLCSTCSIIIDVCARRKKTNRERERGRERTKDVKKLSIECV